MGLAKPITASPKLATPIIGWINRSINDVTAKCTASDTHMTMAKSKSAMAECPAKSKPGVGMSITTIYANMASGIPKILIFMFVLKPPEFISGK